MERKRPSEGNSPSGDSSGRDESRHGRKVTECLTELPASPTGDRRGRDESRHGKKAIRWGTHKLGTIEGGTSWDNERAGQAAASSLDFNNCRDFGHVSYSNLRSLHTARFLSVS